MRTPETREKGIRRHEWLGIKIGGESGAEGFGMAKDTSSERTA